jgi:hypothetical protein
MVDAVRHWRFETRTVSKLNIGGEMDVIGCSRTSRAALASFPRRQIATSAELGSATREGRLKY